MGEFYRLVADHDGDLVDLLKLPSAETVIALGTVKQEDFGANVDKFGASLDALYERFKEAGRRYLDDDRLQILVYNRTKHGASMLRLFEPENPEKFEFVMPNPRAANPGEPPYQFASITVTRQEADKYLTSTRAMHDSIRELAGIARLLKDAGILYL